MADDQGGVAFVVGEQVGLEGGQVQGPAGVAGFGDQGLGAAAAPVKGAAEAHGFNCGSPSATCRRQMAEGGACVASLERRDTAMRRPGSSRLPPQPMIEVIHRG